MYDARNSQIKFYDDTINYVSFGYGNKNLLLIPGLNTERIKGKALQLEIGRHTSELQSR